MGIIVLQDFVQYFLVTDFGVRTAIHGIDQLDVFFFVQEADYTRVVKEFLEIGSFPFAHTIVEGDDGPFGKGKELAGLRVKADGSVFLEDIRDALLVAVNRAVMHLVLRYAGALLRSGETGHDAQFLVLIDGDNIFVVW